MSPEGYKTLESSPSVIRGFCGGCGSSLAQYNSKNPVMEILLGTVDDNIASDIRLRQLYVSQPDLDN